MSRVEPQGMPSCRMQYPLCGACDEETTHDGDSLICDPCRLDYGTGEDGTTASYSFSYDDDPQPCGAACAEEYHADSYRSKGSLYVYVCVTCVLPAGHTSDHYAPCGMKREE